MTLTRFDNAYTFIAEFSHELYVERLHRTYPDGSIEAWV